VGFGLFAWGKFHLERMLLMAASCCIGMFFRLAAASCYGHVTIACSDDGYEGKHFIGLRAACCLKKQTAALQSTTNSS
jgi:hypothetical protein